MALLWQAMASSTFPLACKATPRLVWPGACLGSMAMAL
jgi:hypothetical protein